jgi:hypothetical protein
MAIAAEQPRFRSALYKSISRAMFLAASRNYRVLENSMCRFVSLLWLGVALFLGCAKGPGTATPATPTPRSAANTPQPAPAAQLAPADAERAAAFMAKLTQAFEVADATVLKDLSHPGDEPRDRQNTLEFNQSLMDGGDKVQAWTARPYSEPDWEIMEHLRFHPPPTIWIDVTLHDGKREYPLFFACAPDESGDLKSCYYVDR